MKTHIMLIISALLLTSCTIVGQGGAQSKAVTEVGTAYAAIEGANGAAANGIITEHFMSDHGTSVSIQANLLPATTGHVYEAWLENEDGSAREAVGVLVNPAGDARHGFIQDVQKDYSKYTILRITLQPKNDLATEGKTVAVAHLKRVGK